MKWLIALAVAALAFSGGAEAQVNQGSLLGAAGIDYHVGARDFDGSADYMTRGANLTGMIPGTAGAISVWVRIDGGGGTSRFITGFAGGGGQSDFYCRIGGGNLFQCFGTTTAFAVNVINFTSATAFAAGTAWHHLLASWDSATTTAQMYVDGASNIAANTVNAGAIDYTSTSNWGIAATPAGTNKFNGCMAELWFNPAFIDFSVAANRAKFRTANGRPVNLGADGSTPTGSAPIVYQHMAAGAAATAFTTNLGGGGGMTTAGAATSCSTTPSGG